MKNLKLLQHGCIFENLQVRHALNMYSVLNLILLSPLCRLRLRKEKVVAQSQTLS
jgi:hypothetical protein